MRKKIVAGNWKMNCTLPEADNLVEEILKAPLNLSPDKEVILAPPFVYLTQVQKSLQNKARFHVAAQNCYVAKSGAYTGEISALMLASIGVEYVILGHSERREYFKEDSYMLAKKIDISLQHGLQPIFCCGEPLEVRNEESQNMYVEKQLQESLFHLDAEQILKMIIAYEPVWAIGTGLTATAQQAQDMHAFIRSLVDNKYGSSIAESISILYGGSCKPSNAKELFSCPDVDGGLIGGASVIANDFLAIINCL
jgi:triosephosphate isomerase (TIM)